MLQSLTVGLLVWLAHLKASLTGAASQSQCLWDQSSDSTDSVDKLWKLLSNRFGNENLVEKHCTELRTRRRKSGELLSVLCQDRRLLILSYPGPTSAAHESIAKDSFIDALGVDLSMKVRERDPASDVRQTDGRTDRQTDRQTRLRSERPPAYMQRGKN